MKFNENRSKGSGDMEWTQSVTDGMMDGQTKGIPITLLLLRSEGLKRSMFI